MKTIKLLMVLSCLLSFSNVNSQTCTAGLSAYTNQQGVVDIFYGQSGMTPTVSANYFLDFGNGVTTTPNLGSAYASSISVTYTSNGIYLITLIVTSNSSSCSATATQIVYVNNATPCSLNSIFTVTQVGSTVMCTNVSTGTLAGTTYTWNFRDTPCGWNSSIIGLTSNAINPPPYTYSANGNHCIELIANNPACPSVYKADIGTCSYTPSMTYTISGGGSVITFSTDANGWNIVNPVWTIGDCTSPYCYYGGNTFTHTYFNGIYTPTMHVNYAPVNNCSFTNTFAVITVTNNPCITNSAFTYTVGSAGVVQFSKTFPPGSPNEAHLWYFGDGTTSTMANPTHTYQSAGAHTVKLRSYDLTSYNFTGPYDTHYVSLPCRTFNSNTININGIPCLANSNFSLVSYMPHIYFITPDYPHNITNALWSWGDGGTSHTLYANHTYSAAGNYDVCLTVTTSCGSTNSTCVSQYLAKGATGDMLYMNVIAPQLTNGIEENSTEAIVMETFPNPSNGHLTLKLNKDAGIRAFEVCDLLGNRVYQNTLLTSEGLYSLDLSHLNNGIYFVKVILFGRVISSKFIMSK
jgi:PKD repeat protein